MLFWIVFIGGCILLMRDTETRNRPPTAASSGAPPATAVGSLSFMATWPGNTYWFTPDATGPWPTG